jgi:hypothetical protein
MGCSTNLVQYQKNASADWRCPYYFFMVVGIVGYETTATACWALLFIVRAFFNNPITVAVCTGFHVGLMGDAYAGSRGDQNEKPQPESGGREAGASIFGTTTLEPSRYSAHG